MVSASSRAGSMRATVIIVDGLQRVRPGIEVAPEPVAMDGRPLPEEHAAADVPHLGHAAVSDFGLKPSGTRPP